MWELFQRIQKLNLTPNQMFLLLSFYKGMTPTTITNDDKQSLIDNGYLKNNTVTHDGAKIIRTIDSYFNVKTNKTAKALMGDFHDKFILK